MNILRQIFRKPVGPAPDHVEDELHGDGFVSHPVSKLPHKPELSQADCMILRRTHEIMQETLDELLSILDQTHADLHLLGRVEAANALKAPTAELSAFRFSRTLVSLRAEAHSK